MKQRNNFSLVELLVVVGIIAILAGLVLPAVVGARQKAAIVQAKSDMAAILMALKNVETTYGKMVNKNSSGNVVFNGQTVPKYETTSIKFDQKDAPDAYDALIAELTVPGNQKFNNNLDNLNINKRKLKFLDPKPKFDNSKKYDADADNLKQLWRDPWGNRYTIIINTDYSDSISNPADNTKKLSAKAVIYSWGPNATDNSAKNILVDVGNPKKEDNVDDVASWNN